MKKFNKEPWVIRKLLYYGTALLMTVLAAFGIVTVQQGDEITNALMQVAIPVFGLFTTAMAGAKTTRDSDITGQDVAINERLSTIESAIAAPASTPAEDLNIDTAEEEHEAMVTTEPATPTESAEPVNYVPAPIPAPADTAVPADTTGSTRVDVEQPSSESQPEHYTPIYG